MKKFYALVLLLLTGSLLAEQPKLKDTGNVLINRLQILSMVTDSLDEQFQDPVYQGRGEKSIRGSVLMSAVLPGSGQLYSKSYVKALSFLAIEAAAWAININYRNKGDEQDGEFKAFADELWSEQRYWSSVYFQLKQLPADDQPNGLPDYDAFLVTDSRERPLLTNWEAAEEVLRQWDNTKYLSGFTHHLPETKTQQYYEMIGKYPEQFGNAWDDADFITYYSGYVDRITPLNREYATMRQQANEFYNTAGYGSMVLLINHLVSAIDAGFTARRFNNRQISVSYDRRKEFSGNGEGVNMFGLRMQL